MSNEIQNTQPRVTCRYSAAMGRTQVRIAYGKNSEGFWTSGNVTIEEVMPWLEPILEARFAPGRTELCDVRAVRR
jgi:hypothetical protein